MLKFSFVHLQHGQRKGFYDLIVGSSGFRSMCRAENDTVTVTPDPTTPGQTEATTTSIGKYELFTRAISTSGSWIWSRGAPRNFFRDFADVVKRSQASEASQYWQGFRGHLRALEALAFLTLKYAFSTFLVLFLQIILCTFVWVNYKISFSI